MIGREFPELRRSAAVAKQLRTPDSQTAPVGGHGATKRIVAEKCLPTSCLNFCRRLHPHLLTCSFVDQRQPSMWLRDKVVASRDHYTDSGVNRLPKPRRPKAYPRPCR